MKRAFLYSIALLLFVGAATALSLAAVWGFWIGVWIFHTVPAARACAAIGNFILLPARAIFSLFGGSMDQSMPLAEPFLYALTNGVALGAAMYALFRRTIFERSAPQTHHTK